MKPTILFFSALFLGILNSANAFEPNIFVNLSKRIIPSVVNISTTIKAKPPTKKGTQKLPGDPFRKFFEDYFRNYGGGFPPGEDDEDEGLPQKMALGTGFIIDGSGLILTNHHVVEGADEIHIHFTESPEEQPEKGTVVGYDPELDLCLIQVKTTKLLSPVSFGDSDRLEVGEYVMAVGNPFGQGHSVTHGIISAKDRKSPDFLFARYLQTDAPINPGNSGGPLVNLKGEVIGINNAIDARAQGIGFAIPINSVKQVLDQLKTKGRVTRGYIGILVNELEPEISEKIGLPKTQKGPFVAHVYPKQPADQAGVKIYDLILEVNGKKVFSSSDLIQQITQTEIGKKATLKILRNGKEITVSVMVTERPQDRVARGPLPGAPPVKPQPARIETGMTLETLTPDLAAEFGFTEKSTGVLVSSISYGSPADAAGLSRGDLILEVDRKSVKKVEDFFQIVKTKKSYLVRVKRSQEGNEEFQVVVLDLKEK